MPIRSILRHCCFSDVKPAAMLTEWAGLSLQESYLMPNQKLRSQIVSHRVLNYLNAAYQGRFAYLNVLSQLEHPLFNLEEVESTKQSLKTINDWLDELWGGEILFDESRAEHQSKEAAGSLDLLRSIKKELLELASELKLIIGQHEYFSDRNNVSLLVAAYGRKAYATDNYVRGFIEFGKVFRDSELVDIWEPQLQVVSDDIRNANELLLAVKSNQELEDQYYEHIKFVCRTLPGIFRANSHDISQLLITYHGDFTYDKAGFTKPEANVWEKHEIEPIEAGYWQAHDFGVTEALEWKEQEILDPLVAAEWKTAGVPAVHAAAWLAMAFSPLMAIQWNHAGYRPDQAAVLVGKGFASPLDVPEDQVEQLLEEGLTETDLGIESDQTAEQSDQKDKPEKPEPEKQ